jgi:Protein of unknown function DUF86.
VYDVDREKIDGILNYLERQLNVFRHVRNLDDPVERAAMERSAHMMADSVLDVGNAIIDGFIMRDPGSFEDIIDILLDEQVIDAAMAEGLKTGIRVRKQLIQDYWRAQGQVIYEQMTDAFDAFSRFPDAIRRYLKQQLD